MVSCPQCRGSEKMQPEFTKMDLKLFSQQILPIQEPKFCAIAVYDAMKDLATFVPAAPLYLFRKMALNGRVVNKERIADGTARGAANWVTKVVGRQLTIKYIGKLVVVSQVPYSRNAATP